MLSNRKHLHDFANLQKRYSTKWLENKAAIGVKEQMFWDKFKWFHIPTSHVPWSLFTIPAHKTCKIFFLKRLKDLFVRLHNCKTCRKHFCKSIKLCLWLWKLQKSTVKIWSVQSMTDVINAVKCLSWCNRKKRWSKHKANQRPESNLSEQHCTLKPLICKLFRLIPLYHSAMLTDYSPSIVYNLAAPGTSTNVMTINTG